MAKMKSRVEKIGIIAALWALLVTLAACSAMDMAPNMDPALDYSSGYITTFGVLNEERTIITTDDGVALHISELGPSVTDEELQHSDLRVMFNCVILGNNPSGGLYVGLNRLYPLVVKDIVCYDAGGDAATNFTTPDYENDSPSLLKDAAMPYQASLGNGYVNVNMCYRSPLSAEEELPQIELVYDVISSQEDMVVFQVVYEASDLSKANPEEALNRFQWFSFRIVDEMKEATENSVFYTFEWLWWLDENNPSAGVEEYTSHFYPEGYGGGSRICYLKATS